MRHRAGAGLAETTQAFVIIVSEESNEVAIAFEDEMIRDVDLITLERHIRKFYHLADT